MIGQLEHFCPYLRRDFEVAGVEVEGLLRRREVEGDARRQEVKRGYDLASKVKRDRMRLPWRGTVATR